MEERGGECKEEPGSGRFRREEKLGDGRSRVGDGEGIGDGRSRAGGPGMG